MAQLLVFALRTEKIAASQHAPWEEELAPVPGGLEISAGYSVKVAHAAPPEHAALPRSRHEDAVSQDLVRYISAPVHLTRRDVGAARALRRGPLKHGPIRLSQITLSFLFVLCMIFSENRHPLFGIMR